MFVKITAVLCLFLLMICRVDAQGTQSCSILGQSPASAFPVCTKDTFAQSTVPICTNKGMVVPGCNVSTGDYADKNPFWYRFTCYQAGTLGFQITPNDLNDDYDWQLFDITGVTDLNAVYTSPSLFVVGNWSGSSGTTGASVKGVSSVECASDPKENINTFSTMPVLQQQHVYLLLISHYSDNQSGYKLSFGDGTAVINDPRLPDLQSVKTSCDATVLTLKLNMKMKCSSLSANGTDFAIVPALATVVAASGGNCNTGFDMDSITLTLSNPLPSGNYALVIKKGADANTILDDCDRDIPEGHHLPFTISIPQPTPLDSITAPGCAPSALQLVFGKNIRCSTIATDGSDFVITGPAPVRIVSAIGSCGNNAGSAVITLTLSSPIVKGGVYQVAVKRGTDNNNIIDECGQETPVGSAASIALKDTVSAAFSYRLFVGCRTDTVVFAHDGNNGVNQWSWNFNISGTSTLQTPTALYKDFGEKQIFLKVSNGFCSDSISETIQLNNALKAAFETNDLLCPEDAAVFKNRSTGDIIDYHWDLGDGHSSFLQEPVPENYPNTGLEKNYPVQLIVENSNHCFDTAHAIIKVLRTCYIAVPNAFTPNADGLNDWLYPLNAYKADNLDFNVYNRLGQRVFHSSDREQKWDGTINGHPQRASVYVWTLRYTNHDTGKKIFLKGTAVLIR
ncbi:MAG: gliding motility-associated C-terminal domain-containing protein [Bacteroidota bacterium]